MPLGADTVKGLPGAEVPMPTLPEFVLLILFPLVVHCPWTTDAHSAKATTTVSNAIKLEVGFGFPERRRLVFMTTFPLINRLAD